MHLEKSVAGVAARLKEEVVNLGLGDQVGDSSRFGDLLRTHVALFGRRQG
jgi:hypothetical protein